MFHGFLEHLKSVYKKAGEIVVFAWASALK